jgi:hypothetical protein
MTVVSMSTQEFTRLQVLLDVQSGRLRVEDAAQLMGLGRRQVFRLLKDIRASGPAGLISKRRGRSSNRRLPPEYRELAMALVRERYADFGPTLTAEKLIELHGFGISRETLRHWMIEDGLWADRLACIPLSRALIISSERIILCNESQLKQPATYRYVLGRRNQHHLTIFVGKAERQHLGHEFADLPRRKIHDRRHQSADQVIWTVMRCNLGARPLKANERPEIDLQFIGRLSCLRKRLDLDDPADADIDGQELVKSDGRSRGSGRIM